MGEFLTPVLALILWTIVIWAILYKRRIPAATKMNKDPQTFVKDRDFKYKLPDPAVWAADNYNHLHEQPTIFYALMFYLSLTGQGDALNMYVAWAYVAIRVVHSLVQITSNKVMIRFSLFVLASFMLILMALRAVIALF